MPGHKDQFVMKLAHHDVLLNGNADLRRIIASTAQYLKKFAAAPQGIDLEANYNIRQEIFSISTNVNDVLNQFDKQRELSDNAALFRASLAGRQNFFIDAGRQRIIEASSPGRTVEEEAGAFAAIIGSDFRHINSLMIPGYVRAQVFMAIRGEDKSLSRSAILENELNFARDELDRVRNDYSDFRRSLGKKYLDLYRLAKNRVDLGADALANAESKLNDGIARHDSRMTAISNEFSIRMSMQAPVQYFNRKSRRHFCSSLAFGCLLILFLGASLVSIYHTPLLIGFSVSIIQAIRASGYSAGDALYSSVLVAMIIGAGTIAFFIIRTLSRLLFSQITLMSQSKEKSTIIQTFLALAVEHSLSQEDRSILLSHIFKVSSDGISQDDGGIEASIVALLAKAAGPK